MEMKRTRLLAGVFAVAALVLAALPALALPLPSIREYYNTGGDNGGTTCAGYWTAMQFTTGTLAHSVSSIRLPLKRVGTTPGVVTVSLKEADGTGYPTGVDLCSATYDGDDLSTTTYTWVDFDVESADVSTENASSYTIEMQCISGNDTNYVMWEKDISGGAVINEPAVGCVSANSGVTWAADGTADYLFEIWGQDSLCIQSAGVFSNYIEPGDMLFTTEYINLYPPYYPGENPKQYFDLQLVDTDEITVIASTPCWAWGDMPGAIYLSADQAASVDVNGGYYIRLHGDFTGEPVATYPLVSNDWHGTDLKHLDSWVMLTAHNLETYLDRTLTVRISGKGEILNEEGGVIFQDGIASLSDIRPDLFQALILSPEHTPKTFTHAYDTATTWEETVGPVVASGLNAMGGVIGVDGNIAGLLILFGLWIAAAIVTVAKGGSTFVALCLTSPFVILATVLHFMGIVLLAIVASVLVLLLIFSFWLSRT